MDSSYIFQPPRSPSFFQNTSEKGANEQKTLLSIEDYLNEMITQSPTHTLKRDYFNKIFDTLLKDSDGWPKIDSQIFAQRQLSAYTTNTQFEGSRSVDSVSYWMDFLQLWIKKEGLLLSSDISTQDLIELHDTFATYLSLFRDHLALLVDDNNSEITLAKHVESVKAICKEQLNLKGRVYIPFGYRATIHNPGHALVCLLIKHKSTIKCYIMTRGNGADKHPISALDVTIRYFFRALPIHFSEKDFFGDFGTSLFSRMLRLDNELPAANTNGYDSNDIYSAFWATGEVQRTYDCDLSQRSAKPQLNFNCADDAIKLVVQDYLIDKNYSKKAIKRFFINETLCSLIGEYRTIKNLNDCDQWVMFQHALKEFATTINKKKCEQYINPKEKLLCIAIIQTLSEQVQVQLANFNHSSQNITDLLQHTLPSTFALSKVTDSNPLAIEKEEIQNPLLSTEKNIIPCFYPLETFDITRCTSVFKTWLSIASQLFENKQNERALHFVYHVMMQLPIPHSTNNVWDQLPCHEISNVLKDLTDFVYFGLGTDRIFHNDLNLNPNQLKQVIICYTAYAIADKLARRNPENKLNGFASQFWLQPFDNTKKTTSASFFSFLNLTESKKIKNPGILPIGPINQRFVDLKNYFYSSATSCQQELFHFYSFNIDNALDELKNTQSFRINFREPEKGLSYLKFLLQFLEEAKKKGLNEHVIEAQIVVLWNDQDIKFLPYDIHALRYLSFNSLVVGRCSRLTIPKPPKDQSHLIFKRDLQAKQQVLVLKKELHEILGHYPFMQFGFRQFMYNRGLRAATRLGKKSSINECMSNQELRDHVFSQKQLQEVARIRAEPELSIYSLLGWIQDNFLLISHPSIQILIEKVFFHPGSIHKEITLNRHFVTQVHQFILKGFNHYYHSNENFATWLFIVKFSYCFETFTDPSLFRDTIISQTCHRFQKMANPAAKHALAIVLIHLFSLVPIKQQSECDQLLDVWMSYNTLQSDLSTLKWFNNNASDLFDKLEPDLKQFFANDSSWSDKQCEKFLQSLNIIETSETTWKGIYPIFSNGHITINLFTYTAIKDGYQFKKYTTQRTSKSSHELIEKLLKVFSQGLWQKDNVWKSPDGQYVIIENTNSIILQKKINGPFGCNMYQLNDKHVLSETLSSSLTGFLHHKISQFWEATDASHTIIICDDKTIAHTAILNENNHQICYKLNSDGSLTDHRLVNLKDLTALSPLSIFLKKHSSVNSTLCWMDKNDQLVELDFFKYNLCFQRSNDKLVWKQYPEYFLIFDTHPYFSHFTNYFMISNGRDTRIIIPHCDLEVDFNNFTSNITLSESATDVKYYSFTLDSLSGNLRGENAQAQLYLILILAAQRKFDLALDYLPSSRSFQYLSSDFKDVKAFSSLKDTSPSAIGFNLHFSLLVFENFSQLLSNGFNQKKIIDNDIESSFKDFILWVRQSYESYLWAINQESDNRIPINLRLSHEQELLLTRYLKPLLQKISQKTYSTWLKELDEIKLGGIAKSAINKMRENGIGPKDDWNHIFETRLLVLSNPDGVHKYTLPFMEYLNCPKEYLRLGFNDVFDIGQPEFDKETNNTLPPHFIRITEKQLGRHFYYFYHQALDSPFPSRIDLDILYIARSPGEERRYKHHEMAALLLLVRRNRQNFKDLRFDHCENQTDSNIVLNEIINRATSVRLKIQSAYSCVTEIFTRTTLFPYKTSGEIKLNKKLSVSYATWEFDAIERRMLTKKYLQPFTKLLSPFLTKDPLQRSKNQFFIAQCDRLNKTSTENNLITELVDGFNVEKKQFSEKLHLQFSVPKEEMVNNLDLIIQQYQALAIKLKKEVEALASATQGQRINTLTKKQFEQDSQLQIKQIGKQLIPCTIEKHIFDAIFYKKPNIIAENNPTLSPSEISHIIILGYEYFFAKMISMHLGYLRDCCLSKDISESKLLELFSEAYEYQSLDPFVHSALFLIQCQTNKIFHKEQKELIAWIIDSGILNNRKEFNKLLFTFPAGGGKTSLVIPVLHILAKLAGFMPLTIAPKSLSTIDRENLKCSLENICHHILHVSELDLHTTTQAADFQHFYQILLDADASNGHFEFTPQDYYALDLKYNLALEEKDENSVKWLSLIHNFFETKVFCNIDEVKLNLSPRARAKIGMGRPKPLPKEHIDLFIYIYQALTGFSQVPQLTCDDKNVAEQLDIKHDSQAAVILKDKLEIRIALAKYLVASSKLAIPSALQSDTLNYWLNRSMGKPPSLQQLEITNNQLIEIIDLTRGFLNELFVFVMDLSNCMNYGLSINPGQQIYAPKRKREATPALYEDPYVTLAITIQGMLQNGLNQDQCVKLIKHLLITHEKELALLGIQTTSQISILFDQWQIETLDQTNNRKISLTQLSLDSPTSIEYISRILAKHDATIFWYIEHVVATEFVYYPEQLETTPTKLFNAFNSVVGFSATTGPQEEYAFHPPRQSSFIRQDPTFAPRVLHQLSQLQNQKIHVFESSGLESFFANLYEKDPQSFLNLSMINDVGGFLKMYSNREIAATFCTFVKKNGLPFDGILFFDKIAQNKKDTEDKELIDQSQLFFWHSSWKEPKPIIGNDIKNAMNNFQLNWAQLKTMIHLDPSHIEGFHIDLSQDALALLLAGKNLNQHDLCQAAMRLRGLLHTQKVIWGVEEIVAKQIEADTNQTLSVESIIIWSIKNEAKEIDIDIAMSTYEEIEYLCEKPARDSQKNALKDPKKQIELFHKYRKGFVKSNIQDPKLRFGTATTLETTRDVLMAYAKSCYDRFGYDQPFSKNIKLQKDLDIVIKKLEKWQSKILNKPTHNLNRECHIHSNQQQNQKELLSNRYDHLKAIAEKSIDHLNLSRESLIASLNAISQPFQTVFESVHFTETLRITENSLNTAKSGSTVLGKQYLKSVTYLLIIQESDKYLAFALSDTEAKIIRKKMLERVDININRKLLLVTNHGLKVQNALSLPFSDNDLNDLENSTWFHNVLLETSLISVKIYDLKLLIARIQKWPGFKKVWNSICSWQPHQNNEEFALIKNMIPQEKDREEVAPTHQSTQQSASFSIFNFFKGKIT